MNDNARFELLKCKHKAIMAQKDVMNGMTNNQALEPMFKYTANNKHNTELVELNQKFIIKVMIESQDVNNVNEIDKNTMLMYLDDFIEHIKSKL